MARAARCAMRWSNPGRDVVLRRAHGARYDPGIPDTSSVKFGTASLPRRDGVPALAERRPYNALHRSHAVTHLSVVRNAQSDEALSSQRSPKLELKAV